MAEATHKGLEAPIHAALAGAITQPALQYLGDAGHPCHEMLKYVVCL